MSRSIFTSITACAQYVVYDAMVETMTRYLSKTPLFMYYYRHRYKEHGRRSVLEKLARGPRCGHASRVPRTWLHGASVGELLSLLPIAERISFDRCILTCGTASGVNHPALPHEAVVRYAPFDSKRIVDRFLTNWNIKSCIIAESELWPNYLNVMHQRDIRTALVNARLSERSLHRWQRFAPGAFQDMLQSFDLILCQEKSMVPVLKSAGALSPLYVGNLKAAPNAFHSPSQEGTAPFDTRATHTWLAASTHAFEERLLLDVHERLSRMVPDGVLTIIVPRHLDRVKSLIDECQQLGIPYQLRSQYTARPQLEGLPRPSVYIVDRLGELPSLYPQVPVVIVGGSLHSSYQGHNPFEPARAGCAVLHGPHVTSFREAFADLAAALSASSAAPPHEPVLDPSDGQRIAKRLAHLIPAGTTTHDRARRVGDVGREWADQAGRAVLDETWDLLVHGILPQQAGTRSHMT